MKHNMNRVISIIALLMLTIGAWAGEVVIFKNPSNGGTVVASQAGLGETCTLTVTPTTGYYLKSLKAVTTVSGGAIQAPIRRAGTIDIDETELTITSDASADPSSVTTHTFTMPTDENLNVEVTAEFETLIEINPTVSIEGWTYGGTAKTPTVSGNTGSGQVTYLYTGGNNYSSADAPTSAGSYTVKASIAASGKYAAGECTANFTIAQANFSQVVISDIEAQTYTGSEIKPAITVTFNSNEVDASEYTIGYSNNTNAGTATVTLTTTNKNFAAGETNPSKNFTITGKSITDNMVSLNTNTFVFNNAVQVPVVTVTDGTYTLVGDDYDVSYELVNGQTTTELGSSNDVKNVGSYNVVVKGKGNYTGTIKKGFAITQATLANLAVVLEGWTYGTEPNEPSVEGNLGNGGVNYTYSVYAENPEAQEFTSAVPTNAGSYIVKATVAETANYQGGEATKNFTIAKANFAEVEIADIDAQTYTGSEIKPAITVTYNDMTVDASEYTIGYNNNTNAGTATVTLTTTNKNFAAGQTNPSKNFTITSKSITDNMVTLTPSSFVFSGNPQTPVVTILDNINNEDYQLESTDYDLSYQLVNTGRNPVTVNQNEVIDVATYNVVVTGKGNYTGSVSKSFEITKAPLSLTVSLDGWTYGATANTPTVSGNVGQGGATFYFKAKNADDSKYSEVIPENAGDYTIKVVVAETDNYTSGSATADFTVAKAVLPVGGENGLKVTLAGWTYGATANTPTVTGNVGEGGKTFYYKSKDADDETYAAYPGDQALNAGNYTIKVEVAETANYKSGSATANFTIAQADMSMVTVSYEDLDYNGAAQQLITVNNVPDGAIVKYFCQKLTDPNEMICYPNEDGYSTTVPSKTDAGYYGIIYKIEETNNYKAKDASETYYVKIEAAEISEVTIDKTSMEYKGAAQTVTITSVKAGKNGSLDVPSAGYTVTLNDVAVTGDIQATVVGEYVVAVTGKGNYTGTKSATFTIVNKMLAVTENDFHNHWMTYYSDNGDVDIPVNSNIGAFVATGVANNAVTVTQISNIPEGVAVLLNNTTETTTTNVFGTDVKGNLLVHATNDKQVDPTEGDFYGLYNGVFMRVTDMFPAGKNYLLIPKAVNVNTGAPQLNIVFDNEANMTGIDEVRSKMEDVRGDVYDLMGRKVQKPSKKGLYIQKGRKVVINK